MAPRIGYHIPRRCSFVRRIYRLRVDSSRIRPAAWGFDGSLNKPLYKQSSGRWYETSWRSCKVTLMNCLVMKFYQKFSKENVGWVDNVISNALSQSISFIYTDSCYAGFWHPQRGFLIGITKANNQLTHWGCVTHIQTITDSKLACRLFDDKPFSEKMAYC